MDQERKGPKEPKDPMLDVPAEANREKHINYLSDEDREPSRDEQQERRQDSERRRQWEEGLRAGREEKNRAC